MGEQIVLDAHLLHVLKGNAFIAELDNGHRIVAINGPGRPYGRPGVRVRVRLSPFDMSRGRIVDAKQP